MNQSLRYALARYLTEVPPEHALNSVLFFPGAGLAPAAAAWITRGLGATIVVATLACTWRCRHAPRALWFCAAAFFPLSLLLSPISWKAHHIALLLPFFLLWVEWFRTKCRWLLLLLGIYFVACVALSEEITGKAHKNLLQSLYLITAGDLVLWGVLLGCAWKQRSHVTRAPTLASP
jgi:hypothetical protein